MLHENKNYRIINKTYRNSEIEKKLTHEVVNYFFSRTKLKDRIIELVEIRRIIDDEVLLSINLVPTPNKTGCRNLMVLNVSLGKVIKRDRDNKLNNLFND